VQFLLKLTYTKLVLLSQRVPKYPLKQEQVPEV
jgi:hypothetical protein